MESMGTDSLLSLLDITGTAALFSLNFGQVNKDGGYETRMLRFQNRLRNDVTGAPSIFGIQSDPAQILMLHVLLPLSHRYSRVGVFDHVSDGCQRSAGSEMLGRVTSAFVSRIKFSLDSIFILLSLGLALV